MDRDQVPGDDTQLIELQRLISRRYRPSDALIKLLEQIIRDDDLAVDTIVIDHETKTIDLRHEAAPSFSCTGP